MGRFAQINWLRAILALTWMNKSGHGVFVAPFKRSPEVNRRARRRMPQQRYRRGITETESLMDLFAAICNQMAIGAKQRELDELCECGFETARCPQCPQR